MVAEWKLVGLPFREKVTRNFGGDAHRSLPGPRPVGRAH